jgi:EAL domain-containing protein (putative c-di-GMP-specific phosphodiesterase class I)
MRSFALQCRPFSSSLKVAVSIDLASTIPAWESATHGSVSPGRFIPLAERIGLINGLTEWVIGEALDAQVGWRRVGTELPVSVNLSAKSLPDPELAGWILTRLDDGAFRPRA